ncbi:poly [ADP-ribose] polymerase isoform X2 [Culicoides brevitarsis]|uniref:poly [ADP-ribose] polymerase isoform X2 n=1 Tax=Culicoides brevitarsis TaxID=469753 RepID=UPI00307C6B72
MSGELPFRAEYAKSGRAKCKNCKETIENQTLRLAAMVQSAFHDGKQPNWFHFDCFFKKQRPASEGDIEHFNSLKYEDQKRIRDQIEALSGVVLPAAKGKGKKRSAAGPSSLVLKDFGVEYSASGRATCAGCQIKILKDVVRVKKTVYDTEVGMKFGGQAIWHHLDCFAKIRDELGFYECGDKLPGFNTLSKDDQKEVRKMLPAVSMDTVPVKKVKKEELDEVDAAKAAETEDLIKKQSNALYKLRGKLESNMSKNDFIAILQKNKQQVPEGKDAILDLLTDIMVFGALKPCEKCQGQFQFTNTGYKCTGDLTEWVKCENVTQDPPREKCHIPSYLKEKVDFLKKYKSNVMKRTLRYVPPSGKAYAQRGPGYNVKKEEEGPRVKKERPPLYNMEFVILGKTTIPKDDIKERIRLLGGKVVTKIHERTAAIISSKNEVENMNFRMEEAKDHAIQVVPEAFLEHVEKKGGALEYIQARSICDWGSDPATRVPSEAELKSKSKSLYAKSESSKTVKVQLKGGTAVDPDSGLADKAHVYKEGKHIWNTVLGLTDIQSGKNSYYKMQILEGDKSKRYWLFRAWGRIGTTIGGNKVDNFADLEEAKEKFEELYEEKTGNMWNFRHQFVKRPGKMYPIDVDYGADEGVKKLDTESKIKSELPTPVQDLIKLIFDVEEMKKTMMELELDTEKMPLGRLSKKQLQKAYAVLTELSGYVTSNATNDRFIDASNRFYTLVPHSFGTEMPPLLDTLEAITEKINMLDNLIEIELAYSMLNEETDAEKNPIDGHYQQLKTDITPLDKNSEEFQILQKYVKNTHAETHNQYELEIEDIFRVARKHEDRRYKPFKKLHNRKLLWHGSRLTNWAGILSHGLKIAPPEAPVTGYMFGKGIYFADMVSKSANYCCTSRTNPTGLLMLSEVALGNMQEYTKAHYVEKLPAGKHSVKGVGKTFPDPNNVNVREDGVEIPYGKPMSDPSIRSDLLYNEYIVYDVAQVKCEYLLKVNFKYKI